MKAPSPPKGIVNCEPVLRVATPKLFALRNKKNARNFIRAEITARGFFKYYVQNLPKNKTGCPGKWLFEIAWNHFAASGIVINGIRGEWHFDDNLDIVNRWTIGNQLTVEEASRRTWAYERARDKGFARVAVINTDRSPGNYTAVDVVFLP